jgi:hypothetical protein
MTRTRFPARTGRIAAEQRPGAKPPHERQISQLSQPACRGRSVMVAANRISPDLSSSDLGCFIAIEPNASQPNVHRHLAGCPVLPDASANDPDDARVTLSRSHRPPGECIHGGAGDWRRRGYRGMTIDLYGADSPRRHGGRDGNEDKRRTRRRS